MDEQAVKSDSGICICMLILKVSKKSAIKENICWVKYLVYIPSVSVSYTRSCLGVRSVLLICHIPQSDCCVSVLD